MYSGQSYLFPQSSALNALVPLLARSRQTEWQGAEGQMQKEGWEAMTKSDDLWIL